MIIYLVWAIHRVDVIALCLHPRDSTIQRLTQLLHVHRQFTSLVMVLKIFAQSLL